MSRKEQSEQLTDSDQEYDDEHAVENYVSGDEQCDMLTLQDLKLSLSC